MNWPLVLMWGNRFKVCVIILHMGLLRIVTCWLSFPLGVNHVYSLYFPGFFCLFVFCFGVGGIFYWKIIALQYCSSFCHSLTYISLRHTHVLSSWTSLPSPTPSHPYRLSQSTSLNTLSHTTKSHWLSLLHKVVYMFPCYFLNLLHPLPPKLCAQGVSFPWVFL